MHIQDIEPLLVNKEAAAKMLGIGVFAVNRLIAMGELAVVEIGRRSTRVSVDSIKRYIATHQKFG